VRDVLERSGRLGLSLFGVAVGLNILALLTEHSRPTRWVFEHMGLLFLVMSAGCAALGGGLMVHALVARRHSLSERVGLGLAVALSVLYVLMLAVGPG
jgi:hypothetical protein